MWVVHQRLAELYVKAAKSKNDGLHFSEEETRELLHCLAANASRAWEIAKLENLSLAASMTGDTDWQHDICAKLDKLNQI